MKKFTGTVFAGIAAMMLTIIAFTGPVAGNCISSMTQAIGNVQTEDNANIMAFSKPKLGDDATIMAFSKPKLGDDAFIMARGKC